MELTPQIPADRQYVQRYEADGFTISNVAIKGSVLVFPQRIIPLRLAQVADIEQATLAPVLAMEAGIELLLVGCGRRGVPVAAEIRALLKARRIMLEAMDTGAACRTYNVLMAEGRRVAALLIMLGPA